MPAWITEFSSRFDLALAGLAVALVILRVREARCSATAAKLADPAAAAFELRKVHYQFLFEACIAALGFGVVARVGVGFECPIFTLMVFTYLLSQNPDILPTKKSDAVGPASSTKKPPMKRQDRTTM